MKGLILSGGHGTRLRPLTFPQQKQLIPVANKPVLFYGIEDVIDAGVDEIGIITGPNRKQVEETVNAREWPVPIEFIHQGDPKGLAHTIKVAEDFLGDDDFVMYLGDNILKSGIQKQAASFKETGADASIMLTEVDNPQQFGVADLREDGSVQRLVEKPDDPPSNLALVGIYFFTPAVHDAVEKIELSWRGELEITDAIQKLIEDGHEVQASGVKGWWKDTGKPGDLLHANHLVLDEIERKIEGDLKDSEIRGRVRIEEGAKVTDSTVTGPAVIGSGARVDGSLVSPYTAIGPGCRVENTEVGHSIVMQDSKLLAADRITDSVLGKGVTISKGDGHGGSRFVLGDSSEVFLE